MWMGSRIRHRVTAPHSWVNLARGLAVVSSFRPMRIQKHNQDHVLSTAVCYRLGSTYARVRRSSYCLHLDFEYADLSPRNAKVSLRSHVHAKDKTKLPNTTPVGYLGAYHCTSRRNLFSKASTNDGTNVRLDFSRVEERKVFDLKCGKLQKQSTYLI